MALCFFVGLEIWGVRPYGGEQSNIDYDNFECGMYTFWFSDLAIGWGYICVGSFGLCKHG